MFCMWKLTSTSLEEFCYHATFFIESVWVEEDRKNFFSTQQLTPYKENYNKTCKIVSKLHQNYNILEYDSFACCYYTSVVRTNRV